MKWSERYSGTEMPSMEQIAEFIANPLWNELCAYLHSRYGVSPQVGYSSCSGAPGWNVKYRKGGRSLCTLYPDDGFFTCLVTVGSREAAEAELLLPLCAQSTRELYQKAKPMNGARWLMIPVTSLPIMEDAKRFIALRVAQKRGS